MNGGNSFTDLTYILLTILDDVFLRVMWFSILPYNNNNNNNKSFKHIIPNTFTSTRQF